MSKKLEITAPQNELYIQSEFEKFLENIQDWKSKVEGLRVTDDSQTDKMEMAKVGRLALVKVRTGAKKKKDQLKAESIAYGKAVQGVYNTIEAEIKDLELSLLNNEKFTEFNIRDNRMVIVDADGLEEYFSEKTIGTLTEDEFEDAYRSAIIHKEAREKQEKEQKEKESATKRQKKTSKYLQAVVKLLFRPALP